MNYKQLNIIVAILQNLKLDTVQSLIRRRFIKLTQDELEIYQESSKEIKNKYSIKKEDGSPKLISNELQFEKGDKVRVKESLKELSEQEVKIDFSKNLTDVYNIIDFFEDFKTEFLDKYPEGMNDDAFQFLEDINNSIELLKSIEKQYETKN